MGNTLQTIGTWTKTSIFPFLEEQWRGIWVAISLTGLCISVGFDYTTQVIAVWSLITLLAVITIFDGWNVITVWFGEVITGKYGVDCATFLIALICFMIGSMFYLINPGQMMHLGGGDNLISEIFGERSIEALLMLAGWFLIFASIILFIKNRLME
jgi:hypothetical protein